MVYTLNSLTTAELESIMDFCRFARLKLVHIEGQLGRDPGKYQHAMDEALRARTCISRIEEQLK